MSTSYKLHFLFILLVIASLHLSGQNITKPNIEGPNDLFVNSYSGNLFYQRNDLTLPGQGLNIDVDFSYNTSNDTLNFGYGYGWTFNYGMCYYFDSLDVVVVGMDGRKDRYKKEGNDYIAPKGIFDELEFSQGNQLLLTTKFGIKYYFEDPNHKKLSKIEDLNGNIISLTYNGDYPATITNASNRTIDLQWNDGLLSTIVDNTGGTSKTIQFEYEDQYLLSVTDPLNNVEVYEYGENGKLFSHTDKRGNPVRMEYAGGKVSLMSSCISDQKFTYVSPKTYVVQGADSGRQVFIYEFDDQGRVIKITDPANNSLKYEYDEQNNIAKTIDSNGNPQVYTYDSKGNSTTETDALGGTVSLTYIDNSRLKTVRDKKGNLTIYDYDARGNLAQVTQPEGVTYSIEYDGQGNPTRLINPNGKESTFIYNTIGDLIAINYPSGTESFEYDLRGNVVKIIDANNHELSNEYDDLDRIIAQTDARNKTTTYTYNESGNIETETDPNGNIKTNQYDALGRLVGVTIPAGTTNYSYDPLGNLTQIVDANSHVTKFQYNDQNLPIKRIDPNGNTTSYEYDKNGNLIKRIDSKGNITSFAYDPLNRLISRAYPGNTDMFSYDKEDNVTQAINNDIIISFSYDGLNRLISKRIENWQKEIQYTYDDVGNRTSMEDPDNGITTYTYDDNNRILSIKNPLEETTNFSYDIAGRLIEQINGNGTISDYTYNDSDFLLSIINKTSTNTVLSSYTYTYDDFGNRVSLTDLNNGTTSYEYDGSHRLTKVTYPDGTFEEFAYDPTGNRISLTDNNSTISYTYNQADEIQTAGEISYSFDLNGNMISKMDNGGTTLYQYDGRDRLTTVMLPNGDTNSFIYDPFGNRIELQKSNGEGIKYLYDEDNVLQELNQSNDKQVQYTSLIGMDTWLSMQRDDNSYTYHKDGLGSITGLSDHLQIMKNEYTFSPYGKIIQQSGNVENQYLFTGREYTTETDLYYYRTRFYDANVGRFSSRDKFSGYASLPLSLNKYLYAYANPVNFTDPDGRFPWVLAGAIIGGIALYDFFDSAIDQFEDQQRRQKEIQEAWDRGDHKKAAELMEKDRRETLNGAKDLLGKADLPGTTLSLPPGNEKAGVILGLVDNLGDLIDDNGDQEDPSNNDNNKDDGLEFQIPRLHAVDPNDITGETGYDTSQWVSINDRLGYMIRFENDPDFATAPAQIVRISSPIGPNLNINSFRLSNFGFGQFIFEVPENSTFYTNRLDVIDSLGVFVDITAGIDINKNEVFWIFESIDPLTNLPPEDALAGFLPVNDTTVTIYTDTITQRGEGFVNFTILPNAASSTGDSINQQASIIFDDNAPIPTNIWSNIIDALPPTSTMDTLPDNVAADTVLLQWSAIDDPGGVGEHLYDLYISRDSGQYYLYQAAIDTTEFLFQGILGSSYAFYVRSSDYVGNQEDQKFIEDERIFLGVEDAITLLQPLADEVYCEDANLTVEWEASGSIDLVDVKLIREDTQEEFIIADDISSNQSPYSFQVPAALVGNLNYSVCVTDATGTEAGANASIFLAPLDTTDLTLFVCDPADVGITSELLSNQYGCDSLVVTNALLDTIPPDALCPEQLQVNLTGIGNTSINLNQINLGSSDNCGISSIELSQTTFSCTDFGTSQVTMTVLDIHGNQAICTTTIIVNDPGNLCLCDGDDLVIDDNPITPDIYNAKDSLSSAGLVNAGASVIFKAGTTVILKPGFQAIPGSSFRALIDDCVDTPPIPLQEAPPTTLARANLDIKVIPNPFRESTTIRYTLSDKQEVSVTIFDVNGRMVTTLQNKQLVNAGQHELIFDGDQLMSGIYFVILVTEEELVKRKVVLVK